MNEANKTKNTAEAPDENAGKVPNESAGKTPDKIQWHAGFCSAMQLELKAQWPVLDFSREYSLTKKVLAVDLLVVRKEKDAIIENEVGRFFRGHNLLEYKSPDDEMGIDTYYKLLAYACLYKAEAPEENGIPAEDITISLVREGYPRTLFKFFQEKGYQVTGFYDGIYYVRKDGFFDTQVIVTGKLSKENNIWLASLTRNLSRADTQKLTGEIKKLGGKLEQELSASVLNVVIHANWEQIQKIIEEGDKTMFDCPALNELFAPKIRESNMKVYLEAMKEVSDFDTAKKRFQVKFHLNSQQAEEKMKLYW